MQGNVYNPLRMVKGGNKIFVRDNKKMLMYKLTKGGGFSKIINEYKINDLVADFDIFSEKSKCFLCTVSGHMRTVSWLNASRLSKGKLELEKNEKILSVGITEQGSFAVISTSKPRSSDIRDSTQNQKRLILVKISKKVSRIEIKDEIDYTYAKSNLDDTCYTYLNLKMSIRGNPILLAFEGAHPLLGHTAVTVTSPKLLSTKLDVFRILVESEKMELLRTVDFYAFGGIYDGRLANDYAGDECVWTVDLTGCIKCFKIGDYGK